MENGKIISTKRSWCCYLALRPGISSDCRPRHSSFISGFPLPFLAKGEIDFGHSRSGGIVQNVN